MRFFIILFLLFSPNLFSKESKFNKQLQKDLKKLSKFDGFVDEKLQRYDENIIIDKKNTIVIVYNHGSKGEAEKDSCYKGTMNVAPYIKNLHNKKINNFTLRVYRSCSGVRGMTDMDIDRSWKLYKNENNSNGLVELIDYDDVKFIEKYKQLNKQNVILNKVNELSKSGFKNIILAGHSAGGWASLNLISRYPNLIDGIIAANPAFAGTISDRKEYVHWTSLRDHEINIISQTNRLNGLVFIHNDDEYENLKTLVFLKGFKNLQIINYTDFECKVSFGASAHIFPVYPKENNCFAEWEDKNKFIVKYLESLF